VRVLHVAYSLGESSAATRIAKASLNENDILFFLGRRSSYSLVRDRQVYPLLTNIIGVFFHCINILVNKVMRVKQGEIFSTGFFWRIQAILLRLAIKKLKIDALHIHWGGYSFLPLQALTDLPIKIIITAHDYNYFTGGCHVPMSCDHMLNDCKSCPLVKRKGLGELLVIYLKRKRKRVLFRIKNNIKVVAPSNYTAGLILRSHPFLDVVVIPNPLDAIYTHETVSERLEFYEAAFKKRGGRYQLLVVGVVDSTRDNKGYNTLVKSISTLSDMRQDFDLIEVAGTATGYSSGRSECIKSLTSTELAKIYSSADLCLVPSRYETFSQVTLESISVGTPVVAFDLSGPVDIIEQDKTGSLVESFNENKFSKAVEEYLTFKAENLGVIKNDIGNLRDRFSPLLIASEYQRLYKC